MTKPVFHESLDGRVGEPRGVHVWMCDLDATGDDWLDRGDLLSAGELSLAGRLRLPAARRRFVRSHAIARHLLAGILQKPTDGIAFGRNAFGKPFVQPSASAGAPGGAVLDFNFSHSENAYLFGVCFGGAVGVDVEIVCDDPDWLSVAESFFSPAEMAALRAALPSERQNLFFRYWTMKEASAKLAGRGVVADASGGETETADGRRHFQTTLQIGRDRAAAAVVWTA